MIDISAELFDLSGSLQISPLDSSVIAPASRRATRVATLDQGVAITDRGFSHGDRTFDYRYKPVSEEHDQLAFRLLRLHPTVRVSNREGVFRCTPWNFEPSNEENRFTFIVIEKLSED